MKTEKEIHDLAFNFMLKNFRSFNDSAIISFIEGFSVCQKEYEEKNQQKKESILKITGWDQPYNLKEILSRLVFATDYLLHVKDYDGHNHEELSQSVSRANEILQFLETREAHFS